MSGGGGGGHSYTKSDSSTVSESTPWVGQQPYLTDVFGQAQSFFNQGAPSYYPNATYVDFNPVQEQYFGASLDRAGGSEAEGSLNSWINSTLNQPQFDLYGAGLGANTAIGGIAPAMSGLFDVGGPSLGEGSMYGAGGFNPFMGGGSAAQGYISQMLSEDPTLAGRIGDISGSINPLGSDVLGATAGGEYLGANPYLNDMVNAAIAPMQENFQNTIVPGINATFGMGGRTGSGIHGETLNQAGLDLSRAVGETSAGIYGDSFEAERQRMLDAANSLNRHGIDVAGLGANVYSDDAGRMLAAAGLGSEAALGGENIRLGGQQIGADLYQGGANRGLDAMSTLYGGGLDAIGALNNLYSSVGSDMYGAASMVPQASALDWANIGAIGDVGSDIAGKSEEILADDINRYNYNQIQGPTDWLNNYANIILSQIMNQQMSDSFSKSRGHSLNMSGYGGMVNT